MAPSLSTFARPSLLRRIALLDYPLPLKIHAYLLLSLGVGLTFVPNLIVTNPLFTASSKLIGVPPEAATSPFASSSTPGTVKENNKPLTTSIPASSKRNLSVTGLLALGLGLSYVGTSIFVDTPQENQLMYGAIPLRFIMSATAAASWIADKEARSIFKLTIILEDLAGALWLTYIMKDWPLWSTFRW